MHMKIKLRIEVILLQFLYIYILYNAQESQVQRSIGIFYVASTFQ